jgi:hypothetical protein
MLPQNVFLLHTFVFLQFSNEHRIIVHYRLFHPRLFLAILSNFNIWLLVGLLLVLLVLILFVAINVFYSIGGYKCFLFYWWLLVVILLMAIGGYSINGYWWLFY